MSSDTLRVDLSKRGCPTCAGIDPQTCLRCNGKAYLWQWELAAVTAERNALQERVNELNHSQRIQDSATAAVLERAERAEAECAAARKDAEQCICKGNWQFIVTECEPLIGKQYKGYDGKEYVFFGLVHGGDDYYYGMWAKDGGRPMLLSCVGSIEGHGFTRIDGAIDAAIAQEGNE